MRRWAQLVISASNFKIVEGASSKELDLIILDHVVKIRGRAGSTEQHDGVCDKFWKESMPPCRGQEVASLLFPAPVGVYGPVEKHIQARVHTLSNKYNKPGISRQWSHGEPRDL